ncbi:MAG: low temperature requirement protein A [Sneathiella sp.]
MSEPTTPGDKHRSATWLELFFDLVFVVAIAKAAHILQHAHDGHIGAEAYLKYILIMIPIWWAWTGNTLFANRFDRDDTLQKLLSFAQMFCITLLAANISTDFDAHYRPFLLSYAAIRFLTVVMYVRISLRSAETRPVSNFLSFAFSIGILVSLGSLFFDGPLRYIFLYGGIGLDMILPLIGRRFLKQAPVHAHHLPERFGLLSIILLGESVLSLSNSFENLSWTPLSLTMATGSFIMACSLWWLYFNNMDRHIMGKKLGTGQSVIYSHLFIYSGLGGIAAMIRFAVLPELTLIEYKLLSAFGVLTLMLALQYLHILYHPKTILKYSLMKAAGFNGLFILLLIAAPSVHFVLLGTTVFITGYTILDHGRFHQEKKH